MLTLDLEKHGSLLGTVLGMLSGKADSVKIKTSNNKFDCYFYDKGNNLEVFVSFEALTDNNDIQYFALSSERLKAIISKRKSIQLNLVENMLHYQYPQESSKIKGKVETEEFHSKFKFPLNEQTTVVVTPAIFAFYDRVKLKPIATDREMMLYGQYLWKTKTLYLGGGDNFHLALLTCSDQKISQTDFHLNVPFKYLEMARKIANFNNNNINLYISDKGMTFFTPLVCFTLPLVSTEGSKITMESLLKIFSTNKASLKEVVALNIYDLKLFLENSVSIKETGKSADIQIKIDNKTIHYSIETNHGVVLSEFSLKKAAEKTQIKVSCLALQDMLTKYINSEGTIGINKNSIILTEKQSDIATLELSTVGVE